MYFVYLYTQGVFHKTTTLYCNFTVCFLLPSTMVTQQYLDPFKWDTSPELKYVLAKRKCHFMHLQSFHSVTDDRFSSKSNAIQCQSTMPCGFKHYFKDSGDKLWGKKIDVGQSVTFKQTITQVVLPRKLPSHHHIKDRAWLQTEWLSDGSLSIYNVGKPK